MDPFTFTRAADDAMAIDAASRGARFLAGGTTLVDLMREHVERPTALVDVSRLAHAEVEVGDAGLVLGALARMADVARHPGVATAYPAISEALLLSASPQIRNMASIAGNLLQRTRCTYFRDPGTPCNKREPGSGCPARTGEHRMHAIFGTSEACIATHASDLAVVLLAFDAVLEVQGSRGRRLLPLSELHRRPGTTPQLEHTLHQDELILRVSVPAGPHTRRSHYLKVRDRASYEFALVSAAVALDLDGEVIRDARVAAGGVGTIPWRLPAVEQALVGQPNRPEVWRQAADRSLVGAQSLPQNAFKLTLLPRTIVRALEHVGGRA
ncbi:hypothetical protein TBR22_A18070 [Luteitalea sp. TBR-22]|uniref:FAD binding domain-containing protein n=1 Tax=Luteitalea sp. TBR-22 TaxID=2802971 RepID=UPI001AFAD3E7|nr:xanthine dehydrogenase family protein subunit M [Luteitalea sp. TBR-22]BCS32593.1 hypothetical protein TBR22_A18070 [Luteitalea sp. TBR-22]